MVGVSLVALGGLIIGAGEGSLVGSSLVFPLGDPVWYPNTVAVIGYLFGSISGMCWERCFQGRR